VIVDEIGVRGVPAVIDKDLTAALLARSLRADALVLLTDVEGVHDGWPGGALIREATPHEMRARRFASGSMQPKVEAACRFVEQTMRPAFIGRLGGLEDLLARRGGTRIAR
jgi:carbamate kinase